MISLIFLLIGLVIGGMIGVKACKVSDEYSERHPNVSTLLSSLVIFGMALFIFFIVCVVVVLVPCVLISLL